MLSGMGAKIADAGSVAFVASLHPDRDDLEQVTEALGALWTRGVPVDLRSRYPSGARLALPTMAWAGESYWLDAPTASPGSAGDPLADATWAVDWRLGKAPRRPATGPWLVIGDDAVAEGLAARGAMVLSEFTDGVGHVVFAPSAEDLTAQSIAWTAAQWANRGAKIHLVARTAARPETAALSGLGRVIAAEHPERWGGYVDVHGGTVDDLIDALLADDGEDLVRVTDAGRAVGRLIRASVPAAASIPLDGGAVLITGGFGGVGAHLARQLADLGAKHLVLVGRTGAASAEATARVEELEARGVEVDAKKANVANRRSLKAVVDKIPDLIGVIHAAGTADDGRLEDLEEQQFDDVLGPKVDGAKLLHELTAGRDLRFFVLGSSAAGVLGVRGQANYAAAT
ncbi:MAG: SDR family NAD(P)-dependent oxidoreductase, partial [Myxococcota bacterium]